MVDFRQIRSRLDRAEANLNALDGEIRRFVEEDSASSAVIDRYDAVDESHIAVLKELKPLPREAWGATLGDVVEDLRASLNYLVTSLVVEAGGHVHPAHQFPIADSKDEWKSQVVRPPLKSPPRLGYLDFIDRAHVAQIKALQPYKTASGLPSLLLLRRFSEINRHRLISAARVRVDPQPTIEAFAVLPLTMKSVSYPGPDSPLEDAAELARYVPDLDKLVEHLQSGVAVPAHPHVDVHLELRTTIQFGEPGSEDTALHDFRRCLSDVKVNVIDHFERLLLGSSLEDLGTTPAS